MGKVCLNTKRARNAFKILLFSLVCDVMWRDAIWYDVSICVFVCALNASERILYGYRWVCNVLYKQNHLCITALVSLFMDGKCIVIIKSSANIFFTLPPGFVLLSLFSYFCSFILSTHSPIVCLSSYALADQWTELLGERTAHKQRLKCSLFQIETKDKRTNATVRFIISVLPGFSFCFCFSYTHTNNE